MPRCGCGGALLAVRKAVRLCASGSEFVNSKHLVNRNVFCNFGAMITELGSILSELAGGKIESISTEATVTAAKKRHAEEMGSEGITSRETWSEERGRRAKKFRVEWMSETYFRDWLRPHPTDDTYCICIACDIKLRCGKSELEKHASGMKHCRKMDLMKENPNHRPQLTAILPEGSLSQAAERVLCEENGTFFVTAGGEEFETTALNNVETSTATSTAETVLSKALLKLSKYLDSNSEAAKRKLQMAETEHHRRMQVLNKELELRSIEVLIRQAELQKLNNCPSVQGRRSISKASSVRDDICDDDEEEDVGL